MNVICRLYISKHNNAFTHDELRPFFDMSAKWNQYNAVACFFLSRETCLLTNSADTCDTQREPYSPVNVVDFLFSQCRISRVGSGKGDPSPLQPDYHWAAFQLQAKVSKLYWSLNDWNNSFNHRENSFWQVDQNNLSDRVWSWSFF